MSGRRRAVILESDGIIALDLRTILQGNNCEHVRTLKNFTDLFENIPSIKPDLIIIDSDDSTVSEKIKIIIEKYKIPVLFLTDFYDIDISHIDPERCALIRKPFRKIDFISALRKTAY